VNPDALDAVRSYHKGNVDRGTGNVKSVDGAGVELYAWSSAARAAAGEAGAARDLVTRGIREGRLEKGATVSAQSLEDMGMDADRARTLAESYRQTETQMERVDDPRLLDGFGVNGGEEYLSYMLTSETLVLTGGEAWKQWNTRMQEMLPRIQFENGSWGGQHCITGGAFCTSAVVQCLTAENDAELLRRISAGDAGESGARKPGR
jgi:hypothetical protein